MKIKLSKNNMENIKPAQSSLIQSIFDYISTKSQLSPSSNTLLLLENASFDKKTDDITLHVDFSKSLKGAYNHRSSDIEIVIYIGDGPEITDNSIPCIAFSFDDLIDEKIELLDASIVSENRVEILERLAIRLNDHARQLKDALRRYHLNKKNISGKNSPLW